MIPAESSAIVLAVNEKISNGITINKNRNFVLLIWFLLCDMINAIR
jgi:hypothetical protein